MRPPGLPINLLLCAPIPATACAPPGLHVPCLPASKECRKSGDDYVANFGGKERDPLHFDKQGSATYLGSVTRAKRMRLPNSTRTR